MKEIKYIFYMTGVLMMICTITIAILLIDSDNYTDRDYYTAVMTGFFTSTIGFISIVVGIYCEHDNK